MEWLRLDASYPTNRKTLRLIRRHGKDAAWGHVCILAYCATHETGGVIDDDVLAGLGVDAAWYTGSYDDGGVGLLVDLGGGRYEVHDWGERQPSRGEREAFRVAREARREAGARRAKAYRERKSSPDLGARDENVTESVTRVSQERDANVTPTSESPAKPSVLDTWSCDDGVIDTLRVVTPASCARARAFTDGTDAKRTSVPDVTRDPVDWSLAGEVVQAARERLNINGDQR